MLESTAKLHQPETIAQASSAFAATRDPQVSHGLAHLPPGTSGDGPKHLGLGRRYMGMAACLCTFAISMLLLAVASSLGHLNVDSYAERMLRYGAALLAAPLLALPWLLLVWLLLRKGPRSELWGAGAFVALASLPGGFFLVDAANVMLDASRPRDHVVVVVERVSTGQQSKSPKLYDVVSSWRDPTETLSFGTTLSGISKPGAHFQLTVHAGALGWEYVTDIRPSPSK